MKVISPSLPKIGCHGNVLWGIGKKEVRIDKNHANTFYLLKKIFKIGSADPEIIWLKLKKKLTQAKYIARSASLPSGLKAAFHDTDINTDTDILGVGVDVGVVECGLKWARKKNKKRAESV